MGTLWCKFYVRKFVPGQSLYTMDYCSGAGSGCKIKQLLKLWQKIDGEIGGGRICERKILSICLERQEVRVRETRYRTCLDESNEGYNVMRKK